MAYNHNEIRDSLNTIGDDRDQELKRQMALDIAIASGAADDDPDVSRMVDEGGPCIEKHQPGHNYVPPR